MLYTQTWTRASTYMYMQCHHLRIEFLWFHVLFSWLTAYLCVPSRYTYLICFPRVLSWTTFGEVVEEVPVLTLMPSAHALLLSQQEHVVVLAGMNVPGL